jgi:hypothetical protein
MNRIEQLNQLLSYTIWLPIKNYENYEISICGQVRNATTKRILKLRIGNHGYYYIHLWKNGKEKYFLIHRLVAITFIPNIKNEKFVDHVNNNQLDNTISNLRWCDLSKNQFNRILNKNNNSGIKGVYWNKKSNKWHTQIKYNNKCFYLGSFDDIDDAKLARQNKSTELFGEFLNNCEK